MIPKNNQQKFIEKYGELYYIREFDYLPEPLKYYDRNISTEFMKNVEEGHFELFKTKEEAANASYEIRRLRGIVPFSFDREHIFDHELESIGIYPKKLFKD